MQAQSTEQQLGNSLHNIYIYLAEWNTAVIGSWPLHTAAAAQSGSQSSGSGAKPQNQDKGSAIAM